MLDTTKADHVEYCWLFHLLIERGLPSLVFRLLVNLCTNHVTRIAWHGILFSSFEVLNGVNQGGVCSPVLCLSPGCCLHLRILVLVVIVGLLVC